MAQDGGDRSIPPERSPPPAPFIVTAELPGDIFAWADGLRREHFPPERNKLAAHVTLFHSFAPSLREELSRMLGGVAAAYAPSPARVDGLMNLGTGTALAIASPGMDSIREAIADHFHGSLTRQDAQRLRLHITIQNKVSTEAAKALQRALAAHFRPREFRFRGLGLHIYRGTHWDALAQWSFRGAKNAAKGG